jgi:hypothetical protein
MFYGFSLRMRVDMTLRRELTFFNVRLTGVLDALSDGQSDDEFALWDEIAFKGRADQSLVQGPHSNHIVIRGTRENETFEEMNKRLRESLAIPLWPGGVGFFAGLFFLAASALPSETRRSQQNAGRNLPLGPPG